MYTHNGGFLTVFYMLGSSPFCLRSKSGLCYNADGPYNEGELEKVSRYTIGLDYGTLSGRAVLAVAEHGCVLATAVYEYPHAVMDRTHTLRRDFACRLGARSIRPIMSRR